MKTKLIAFTLAALLSAGAAWAAPKMFKVGHYIVFYEQGDTQGLVCVNAPIRGL